MNPQNARFDSLNQSSIEFQLSEKNEHRVTENSQPSEILSSSLELGLCQSTVPSHSSYCRRDIRREVKNKEETPLVEHVQKTRAFANSVINCSSGMLGVFASSAPFDQIPQSDPDHFFAFNTFNHHVLSDQFDKSCSEHSNETVRKKVKDVTAPGRQKGHLLSKHRAHSMSPNLESGRHLDLHENDSPQLKSATATVRCQQKLIQPNRNSSVGFRKATNSSPTNQSRSRYDSVSEETERSDLAIQTNHSSQQDSEISARFLTTYKARSSKIKNTSSQATTAASSFPGTLHQSQSRKISLIKPRSVDDLESLKLSYEHWFEPEDMRTKAKSIWNNIKYGWAFKSKPVFKCDSPLFMLGRCYHRRKDDPDTEPEDQFLRDFVSRIWMTYRSNFYPIPGTKLNTDCGWGCMLRTGQMLIAQCLVNHFLGRDWRLYNKQTEIDAVYYREIIRWFSDPLDSPSDTTPFSLHHLINIGRSYDKLPGEWYGPASVAVIFRDAFMKASHTVPVLSQLCLYVAQDCTVYVEDVISLCTGRHRTGSLSSSSDRDDGTSGCRQEVQQEKWLRSLIILIPLRLGGEVMNEIYIPCVQSLLSHDNCMGIIGGRPKHSLYFLGWQDDKLIYLDPHLCREAVDTTASDFRIESFHCMTPRKLAINKMDPSCTVGFYIRDGDDFRKFLQEVKEFASPPKQKGLYPMFTFSDGRLCDSDRSQSQNAVDRRVRVTHYFVDQNGRRYKKFSGESEEFVLL